MADPFSALGCAAAVLQFLEFTTKMCRKVQTLYETSSGPLLQGGGNAFGVAATDFIKFSQMLQERKKLGNSRASDSGRTGGDGNDEAIDNLVLNCARIAAELSTIFTDLAHIASTGHVVKKALKFMEEAWKYDDIVHLVEQMDAYQRQLVLRILWRLDSSTETRQLHQDKRFDVLEHNISQIVEVIAVQGQRMQHGLDQAEASRKEDSNSTLAAILTLANGDTQFLSPRGAEMASTVIAKGDQTVMRFSAETKSKETKAKVEDFRPVQDEVLRCLYFRHSGDRFDSVKDAYTSTYRWIFEPPNQVQAQAQAQQDHEEEEVTPWTPFLEWLEEGHGIYWINGKAGSGKSTLMKYVLGHPRTQVSLEKWAAGGELASTAPMQRELVSSSFFFWNLGSSLQKSQHGLLRSLLYDILTKHRQLVAAVMPELWWAGLTMAHDRQLDSPSFPELLRWFRRLLDQARDHMRMFFLIDGLDEYEGDHSEVIALIRSFTSNTNVKFLVSSRPLPVCVDAFSELPALRLQDLTRDDIRHYAEGLLKKRLESRHGAVWEQVIRRIVKKSCGVFLWVILVVRSLIAGLQNYDTLDELLVRLDEFPSELERLYATMLKRMDQTYRIQASQLFQFTLLALDAQQEAGNQLTPVQLHYAMADDSTLDNNPKESEQMEDQITNAVEGRIRSRCAGLLEVRYVKFRMTGFMSSGVIRLSYVDFIHRTAVEFLREAHVWADMLELTSSSGFHPAVGLSRSCVAACKFSHPEDTLNLEDSPIWYNMDRALHYASLAEAEGKPVSTYLLCRLDEIMSKHWTTSSRCKYQGRDMATKGHWTNGFNLALKAGSFVSDKRNPASLISHAARPFSFHSLAVFHCLNSFVHAVPPGTNLIMPPEKSSKWSVSSSETPSGFSASRPCSQASFLLWDATRNLLVNKPWAEGQADTMSMRCAALCSLLLEYGADPNVTIGPDRDSSWNLMLFYCAVQARRKQTFHGNFDDATGLAQLFSRLLVTFVKHGADVHATVFRDHRFEDQIRGDKGTQYSALQMVDVLFSPNGSVDEYDDLDPYGMSSSFLPALPSSTPPWASQCSGSSEIESFHRYLASLMGKRGAVARTWEIRDGPPQPYYWQQNQQSQHSHESNANSSSMLLSPPSGQQGYVYNYESDSKSTSSSKRSSLRKLGSMFRKSPKSSIDISR